jgi:hypothetical protein
VGASARGRRPCAASARWTRDADASRRPRDWRDGGGPPGGRPRGAAEAARRGRRATRRQPPPRQPRRRSRAGAPNPAVGQGARRRVVPQVRWTVRRPPDRERRPRRRPRRRMCGGLGASGRGRLLVASLSVIAPTAFAERGHSRGAPERFANTADAAPPSAWPVAACACARTLRIVWRRDARSCQDKRASLGPCGRLHVVRGRSWCLGAACRIPPGCGVASRACPSLAA